MRQGSSGRRPRSRSSGGGGGGRKNVPLKNQNFDSNGPDVRVRGNATQVYEKYLALARDATSAGDRVIAESYFQHAEHYYRIINENTDPSYEDLYGREPNGYDGDDDEDDDQPQAGGRQARGTRQERRERYEQDERRGRNADGQQDARAQGGNGQGAADDGADTRRPDGYGQMAQPQTDGEAAHGDATDGQGAQKSKRNRGRPRKAKGQQAGEANGHDETAGSEASGSHGADEGNAASTARNGSSASEDNA
jgi:hypothetical protein